MAPHTRKKLDEYVIIFGGNPEPIFLNTASDVECGILKHGKPAEGIEEVNVTLHDVNKKLTLKLNKAWGSDWGRPGWYHERVFFTKKGDFKVSMTFVDNGKTIESEWSIDVVSPLTFP